VRNQIQLKRTLSPAAHPLPLYRVLRLLSSVDVFSEVDGGRFAQTATSELLRTGRPGPLRQSARQNKQLLTKQGLVFFTVQK
jgi:hypothetical protein